MIIYSNLKSTETHKKIKKDNNQKAGIYKIENKINNKKYIGSASTNRIYSRFRSHMFLYTGGSKVLNRAIQKYGIENFTFQILEYYPGFVKKENLKKNHLELLGLEKKHILKEKPEYNILEIVRSSLGYKHSEITKLKAKSIKEGCPAGACEPREREDTNEKNYSEVRKGPRKIKIKSVNLGLTFTKERKQLLSEIAKLRNSNQELRNQISKKFSKRVILFNLDGSIHSEYEGIRKMAKIFHCCNKTINKSIQRQSIFRKIGYIRYKPSDGLVFDYS